ncbi:hypothetical protein F5X98DRAFT_373559 [Xylaria grammica]|nr:hypothetical protein F5X98DRAFT_373559 [Xylaria grammica]
MTTTTAALSGTASPDAHYGLLPWGCRLLIEPWTRWPLSKDVVHAAPDCECAGHGGARLVVAVYLFTVAYDVYYMQDPQRYSPTTCDGLVNAQADRIGLDLRGMDMWTMYPELVVHGSFAPAA